MKFRELPPKPARLVAAGLIGLAVWVLRVSLVGDLGTGIPLMDQWSGEGLAVYEPWLQGQLTWRAVFEPHLEHRIVWTHLWNLGLLELCGQWEPMVQMVAQAGITAATAGVCVWILLPMRTEWYWRASVLVGAVLAFGFFFAYENILWGFQSQFGFFILLCVGICATTSRVWQNRRYAWLALLTGMAAPLAMGAGALAGPTIVALAALASVCERKISPRSGGILVIGLGCLSWGLFLRSDSPATAYAHAKSFGQFFQVWISAVAWPNSSIQWLAGLACLPMILLIIQIVRRGMIPAAHELFLCGVFFWAVASAAGGAWLRGSLGQTLPSRYCDILALLCWVNLLALVMVMKEWWPRGRLRFTILGAVIVAAWLGSALYGGIRLGEHFIKVDRPAWRKSSAQQFEEANSMVEGLADAISAGGKLEKMFLPPERVIWSQVLGPYLPPEIRLPFKGITPHNALAIGLINASHWTWQSEKFEAKAHAMVMFVRGDGAELQLRLENQSDGNKMEFVPSGRWIGDHSEWMVRTTPGEYRLGVRTAAVKGGLVMTLPRQLSISGYWVRRGVAEGVSLCAFAGICLALAWLAGRNRPGAAHRPERAEPGSCS